MIWDDTIPWAVHSIRPLVGHRELCPVARLVAFRSRVALHIFQAYPRGIVALIHAPADELNDVILPCACDEC